MRSIEVIVAMLLAMVPLCVACNAAQAQEQSITFRFKSTYDYKVQVAFFSQHRNYVWPGKGSAYNLDDSKVHEIRLKCLGGERICYGGWVAGNAKRYWGVGSNGKLRCDQCYYICSSNETPLINLHD